MSETKVGGWSHWGFELTKEATKVFEQAMTGFVGVKYTSLAFATQVVAGMNYCYLCKGEGVYPGAEPFVAKVIIYCPPKGEPHITDIIQVEPGK